MARITKTEYEVILNREISENYSYDDAYEKYVYLTTKCRSGGTVSKNRFKVAISVGSVGSLIRWYDPIAFEVGYNEWKRKKP